jgi:serine/threonine-protein kinase haspin
VLIFASGDYQFDIYRFMREHVSSGLVTSESKSIDWKVYAPRTNVFWLHYLATILLTKMGIPRPISRGKNAVSLKERGFFKQLETLARAIDPRHKRFKKSVDIESSQKLVEWAVAEGIIATGV